MSTNDHSVWWNASSFDMALWMMAVEDKFTLWMQGCSGGVYDINVICTDFMETFAKVADHIIGRRPKLKPSSGSWWTKDLTYLQSFNKCVRKAGQKFASTEIKSMHNQLQRTFNQRKRLAKELLSEKQERKFEQSMKARWGDAFKQLDEEYVHKKLGSVVYERKSSNDDQEKANVINRFFASVGKHDGDTKVEVLTTSASGTHGQQEIVFLQPISRSEVEMALKQTKV